MILFLKKLHNYLLIFFGGVWYFVLWVPLNWFALKQSRYNGMIYTRRIWAFLSSLCVGILYKFEFEEPIDWSRPYVICSNHMSNLDTSMICMLVPHANYSIMGKQELVDGMVTGIFFKTVDIPVNRDSKMSSFRAFKAAGDMLDNERSVVMFPEAGIADQYPPTVQEFKNGPFRLAIDNGVMVLPVTSTNTWRIMWDDGFKFGTRPGVCKIHVHKPIATVILSVDDANALKTQVRDLINQKFNEINGVKPAAVYS